MQLLSYDQNSLYQVAAAFLFPYTNRSLKDLEEEMKTLSKEQLGDLLDKGACFRNNRRHKSPRGLERASFTFEIVADFGVYRDLQRHRMLTQERQLLTCSFGYFIPEEVLGTEMEKEYEQAMESAKKVYDKIAKEFPEEAQYVVPMAYHIRWYFHVNLRALQWMCELRSSPQGHPSYRLIVQRMGGAGSGRDS